MLVTGIAHKGEGHNESYRALELSGTTSTGYVAFWQEVPAYPW